MAGRQPVEVGTIHHVDPELQPLVIDLPEEFWDKPPRVGDRFILEAYSAKSSTVPGGFIVKLRLVPTA